MIAWAGKGKEDGKIAQQLRRLTPPILSSISQIDSRRSSCRNLHFRRNVYWSRDLRKTQTTPYRSFNLNFDIYLECQTSPHISDLHGRFFGLLDRIRGNEEEESWRRLGGEQVLVWSFGEFGDDQWYIQRCYPMEEGLKKEGCRWVYQKAESRGMGKDSI